MILPSQLGEFQLVKTERGGLCQLASEIRICVLANVAERGGKTESVGGDVHSMELSKGRGYLDMFSSLRWHLEK